MPERPPGPTRPEPPAFTVAMRGYDRAQVDEYLQQLSADLGSTHARAVAAEQQLARRQGGSASFEELGPHVAGVLQHASQQADLLRGQAEEVRRQAEDHAQQVRDRIAQEDASAVAQRDALLAEARTRADELLQRAQSFADRRAEEIVDVALAEAAVLQRQVDQLRDERRAVVGEVSELAARLAAAVADAVEEQPAGEAAEAAATRQIDLRDADPVQP